MADKSTSCVQSAAVRNLGGSWSSTDFPVHKVLHRWTINKIRMLCRSGIVLVSAPFSGGSTDWHLELNPSFSVSRTAPLTFGTSTGTSTSRGLFGSQAPVPALITRSTQPTVQIKLVQDESAKSQMMVEYTLSIVSQNLEFECNHTDFYIATAATSIKASEANLISQSDLLNMRAKDLLVNDALTVLCELTLSFISDKCTISYLPSSAIEDSLSKDLGALLQSTELSNVTLVVGEKEFPAHRIILSARSPVFKAMFEHDMREKMESRVNVTDLSADTAQGMLQWIYTGRLPTTEQESKDLLCASDKYSLEPLKVACERSLCQSLAVSNAVDLFELADLHRAAFLKSNCMRVIAAHSEEVKATERWQQLKRERVDLLIELCTNFLDL